ncbi:MAG: heterodisulfide reductase-related iron-sulfur binding cluster [Syntrophomonadaceae bacterium]|nr:heterodisulfide reductase-related iron-sulfur binding cluster [Syntrophomonadaceae bacterium]MDD4550433.1 heterodisulfide reductase-related iron-sulfur binding cluster [Syntrophomonadaceae bacterium]
MKNMALFPGCLVLSLFPEYELASKKILALLDIQTHTLPETICCGSVLQSVNSNWIYAAAYDLALAERSGMEIITLCGGCTNSFKRLQWMCRSNPLLLDEINEVLAQVGLSFHNTVHVSHILEILFERKETLRRQCCKSLPLRVAVMTPCQVFRPANVMHFDDSDHPRVMQNLISSTVAEVVSYSMEDDCCGSSLSMSQESVAFRVGQVRLEELEKKKTDMIITACGNCHLLLQNMQSAYYQGRPIPCLFLPQLLGVAMGFSSKEMMISHPSVRSLIENV